MAKRTDQCLSMGLDVGGIGNAGMGSDRDDGASPGSVHQSHAKALGAMLWGLAAASIVVGRYATIGRVRPTVQALWVPLVQILAVLAVFGVLVPLVASCAGRVDISF